MKLIFVDKDTLWCGTQASLEAVLAVQDKLLAGGFDLEALAGNGGQEVDKPAPRYEVTDGVAVIPIRGPLINADIPDNWVKAFGITTYPNLQRAFAEASADSKVKSVLLDVNSPGGSVAGISDTTDALSSLRAVKPVHTFAGDLMASAGYWLGSNADRITAGKMSTVGSIGVIGTHIEYSREMENDGIKATVLRAGSEKALATPYEPLSDKAKAQMQARLDAVYGQFVEAVANNRGVSLASAMSMAEGREYFGEAALRAGLVDTIGKFPDALAFAKQKVDNGNMRRNNALSAQIEELDMSGTAVQQPGASSQVQATLEAQNAPQDESQAESQTGTEVETPSSSNVDSSNQLVAYLTEKVATQEQQLRDAAIAATLAQAQVAAIPSLRVIAEASLNQMRIALGHTATDAAALSPDALVAEHQRVSAEFGAKFPVGGVAASSSGAEVHKPTAAQVDPTHLARVQATRIN